MESVCTIQAEGSSHDVVPVHHGVGVVIRRQAKEKSLRSEGLGTDDIGVSSRIVEYTAKEWVVSNHGDGIGGPVNALHGNRLGGGANVPEKVRIPEDTEVGVDIQAEGGVHWILRSSGGLRHDWNGEAECIREVIFVVVVRKVNWKVRWTNPC